MEGDIVTEGITTPYDDFPLEVRREYWGWFGEPWPSFICYDEDGRLIEEMRKEFPHGQDCLYCGETFNPDTDSGRAMPFMRVNASTIVAHCHKECFLRQIVGSPEHLTGHTGQYEHMTEREKALWVWDWVGRHGPTPVTTLPGSRACAETRTGRPAPPPPTPSAPTPHAPGP